MFPYRVSLIKLLIFLTRYCWAGLSIVCHVHVIDDMAVVELEGRGKNTIPLFPHVFHHIEKYLGVVGVYLQLVPDVH